MPIDYSSLYSMSAFDPLVRSTIQVIKAFSPFHAGLKYEPQDNVVTYPGSAWQSNVVRVTNPANGKSEQFGAGLMVAFPFVTATEIQGLLR